MVKVEDVKLWATDPRGIGHAVAYTLHHYVGTACNSFANFTRTDKRPKRICSRCRERLKEANHVSST